MRSSIISLLALTGATVAQQVSSASTYSSAQPSSSGTATSSQPITYTVAVGKAGNTFSPDVVQARPGDSVEFQFYPTNHSVIRAEYGYPCVPYELVKGAGYQGFFSGFKPVDAILTNPPSWSIRINDTDPVFYYCGAPGSCIGFGMVGVINPNANTSLARQRQLAEASTYMLEPGENWPSEGPIPSGVATSSSIYSSSSSSQSTTTATATPAAATTTAAAAAASHGISGGAIGGIVVGAAAVLLAAGVAIWFCGRSSHRQSRRSTPVEEMKGDSTAPVQGYGKHMSTMTYSTPPGYDSSIRSPVLNRTPEPQMDYYHTPLMQNSMGSPNMGHASPVPSYGPNYPSNAYAVGTHRVGGPIEMAGDASNSALGRRTSTEKDGVERYS